MTTTVADLARARSRLEAIIAQPPMASAVAPINPYDFPAPPGADDVVVLPDPVAPAAGGAGAVSPAKAKKKTELKKKKKKERLAAAAAAAADRNSDCSVSVSRYTAVHPLCVPTHEHSLGDDDTPSSCPFLHTG
jgi:hypothetical protein